MVPKAPKVSTPPKYFSAQYLFIHYELKRSVLLANEFYIICQKCGDSSAMPLRNMRARLISRTNRFKYIKNISRHRKMSVVILLTVKLLFVIHHHNPLLIDAASSGIMNVSCKTEEEPARVAGSSSSSPS